MVLFVYKYIFIFSPIDMDIVTSFCKIPQAAYKQGFTVDIWHIFLPNKPKYNLNLFIYASYFSHVLKIVEKINIFIGFRWCALSERCNFF